MTIDYDVVIIGGSSVGRYAASYGAKLNAKVALIEPHNSNMLSNSGQIIHEVSKNQHVLHNLNNLNNLNNLIYPTPSQSPARSPIDIKAITWSEMISYTNNVAAHLEQMTSLENLAALGVDVIIGDCEFSSKLAIGINGRLLKSRTYLLANNTVPKIPQIPGLETTSYLTLSNIWQYLAKVDLPKTWLIIGGTPQSIEISQTLARLGCRVILATKRPCVLDQIAPEIAQILLAQLEVNGVNVITSQLVMQLQQVAEKKIIQIADQVIEVDEILVAVGQQPNLATLNLTAVGVRQNYHRIVVNHKLQTTNHRIYACGSVIGGYDFEHIAEYEAKIALKNALFLPIFSVNYANIPWVINTHPVLAQVGLTAAQAKRHYQQNEILVLQQYFKVLTAAQIHSEITGICQFVVLPNGQILGASILGAEAQELIGLISLAMQQNISVNALASLSPIYPSFTEILVKTAQEWSQYKSRRNNTLQEFLTSFFYIRRDWKI